MTADVLVCPEGDAYEAARNMPMPDLDESTKLGKILSRYYSNGLGGAANWDQVESLRASGTVRLGEDTCLVRVYLKKPNYIKIVLEPEGGTPILLGYDGAVAWRQYGENESGFSMDESEARSFIHSAIFGSHLLYPYSEGKRVEYIDTIPVDGSICHHVRVSLPTEFVVDYFIDVRSYLELKAVNTDRRTNHISEFVYEDYIRTSGIPIALSVSNYAKGELLSSLKFDEVKANTGIMPFMFQMPK